MQTVSIDVGDDGTLSAVLRGELDFTQAARIVAAMEAAIDDCRPDSVRVDLAEVTFLDSSGIGALVRAMKAADQVNASFVVERPTLVVFDQLNTAGLVDVFGLRRA
ncbi:hypothetical protein Ade02nite_08970 [Paractinoplanes deccanensis]|uniref:STAS domain-containing protein n=1 Tax=Paractinoplanes deccanensis TaxID=113561 RepID=A0ABQ3XWY6_9ACTN|nr:STAS domain-containing protein [Actinoplanes deccanensis]GID72256.1 hypothetical protein Ade02nite_08970 [Actinoplanes deccanensis]